ncbi:MAG: hypothetical protein H0U49_02775 [Parachlamydiaceae bacterium]|nr:hypothetical protein [Parachlamydiaceae bacterium]
MHIHPQNAYNSITAPAPIAPLGLKQHITEAFKRFNEFIKAKFNELHQLFMRIVKFYQKPNIEIITPKTTCPAQNKTTISTPANVSGSLWQTTRTQNIDKERQVNLLAIACGVLAFIECGTIFYFRSNKSPGIEAPSLQCPSTPLQAPTNLPINSWVPKALHMPLNPFICGINDYVFMPSLEGAKTTEIFTKVVEKAAQKSITANISNICPTIPLPSPLFVSHTRGIQANIINKTIPYAIQQMPTSLDSLQQILANPYSWAIGAGVFLTAAFAYGYFSQRRINRELQEQIRQQSKNQTVNPMPSLGGFSQATIKESFSTFKGESRIEQENKEGDRKKPDDKPTIPIIPLRNTISNIKVVPETKTTFKTDDPLIPRLNLNQNFINEPEEMPLIEVGEEFQKLEQPKLKLEKASFDFTRYHIPIIKSHAAFEGKEEYEDKGVDTEKSSKKNLCAGVELVGLMKLFKKEKSEVSDDYEKSEVECLLESFRNISREFNEKERSLKQWELEQKAKASLNTEKSTNRPRGGKTVQPARRGEPAKRGTLRPEKKVATLNEAAEVWVKRVQDKEKYDDALNLLKQTLIPESLTPDSKYSKYEFTYNDFHTISQNIERDIAEIEKHKLNNPKTPRSTILEVPEAEIKLTKEERALAKKKDKYVEDLLNIRKKTNNIDIDKRTLQKEIDAITASFNKIKPEEVIAKTITPNEINAVQEYRQLIAKMEELNNQLESIDSKRTQIFENAPTESLSPTSISALSKYKETTDPEVRRTLANYLTPSNTPRKTNVNQKNQS